MSKQPEALRLADQLERMSLSTPWDKAAAAELRRLHQQELALIEWIEKTHWVQVDAQPLELGRHRADVIQMRVASLHAANIDCVNHFNAIKAEHAELLAVLKGFSDYVHAEQSATDGAVTYSTTAINHWAFLARDAIAKATGAA